VQLNNQMVVLQRQARSLADRLAALENIKPANPVQASFLAAMQNQMKGNIAATQAQIAMCERVCGTPTR
jgi:hypothetical protein